MVGADFLVIRDRIGSLMHSLHIKSTIVVVVGQTVGSISSKMLAYDCLYTLELCTASMISSLLPVFYCIEVFTAAVAYKL